jgi:hypothetical protein
MTKYDQAYSGDLNKWIRYANSLKFKIAMLMVDKDPSKADLIKSLLNEGNMIQSAADNFKIPFFNQSGKENPKYRMIKTYAGGENFFFFANKTVMDYMKPKNDPRLSRYFDLPEGVTEYIAIGTNDLADESTSPISMYLYRPDAPEAFFTYQEQLFFEAEAYARGLGVAKNLAKAQDLFVKAVREAMTYYEADPNAIDTYISTQLPNLQTVSDPVKEIHLQQWIDLMDRPIDAFTQWRRSGKEGFEVPVLPLPNQATAGPLFRRFEYSPDEATANPNTPQGVKYYDKMWFDE